MNSDKMAGLAIIELLILVIAHADRAMERLYRRFMHMIMGGKHYNKTVVATARELVGFIWAVLYVRVEEGKC